MHGTEGYGLHGIVPCMIGMHNTEAPSEQDIVKYLLALKHNMMYHLTLYKMQL